MWSLIRSEAPGGVVERLKVFIRLIGPIASEKAKLTAVIEHAGGEEKQPRGVGALAMVVLRRGVGDWSRFINYPEQSLALGTGFARQPTAIAAHQCREVSSSGFAPPPGAHPGGAA